MEQNHSFTKGMNKDFHPMSLQEGQYVEANNAVLMNPLQGNSYSLCNEPGFVQCVENGELLKDTFIIGMCNIKDDMVLFLIRVDNQALAISQGNITSTQILNPPVLGSGISSEVGTLTKNPNGSYRYKTVLNDKNPSYWSTENDLLLGSRIDIEELLNFNIEHQIACTARFDYADRPVVYWTDGLNDPRMLVLSIDYTDDFNKHTFREIAQQVKLIQAPNLPYIRYNRTLVGGSIYPGVYQFAARYLNETLDPTTFGYICHPIPVTDGFRSEGRYEYDGASFEAPLVSKSIELSVHNIDQNFAYIEYVCIFYRTAASTPVIKTIGRYNIKSTTMTVIFDGVVYDDITLQELLREPVIYNTAEHILQKDGRLILSNLTTNPNNDLQDLANNLRVRYCIREIPITEDDNFYEDYKEENNTFEFKGYRRNEVYDFGIIGVFKDGSKSFVHHIPGPSNDPDNEDIQFNLALQAGGLYSPDIYDNSPPSPNNVFQSKGYLNPYISNEYYPDAPLVTKVPPYYYVIDDTGAQVSLVGYHVRYHRMPTIHEEPHIRKDPAGNDWLRVLGIQIDGIEAYLNKSANIKLKNQLVQIIIVRQERKRQIDKSILSQGCLNILNFQEGRKVEEPTIFNVDYKLGIGNLPIDLLDHLADAVFTIANPLYTIGLNNLEFNGRLEPYNINKTYSIDPFWNSTNIKTKNQAIFYNGEFTRNEERTYDHVGFFSPESCFIKSFNCPGDSIIKPVMKVSGGVERITNTRIEPFIKFLDGSYNGEPNYPYNGIYRGPYYHLFANFTKSYSTINTDQTTIDSIFYRILQYKRSRWNDIVSNNGNIQDLPIKVSQSLDGKKTEYKLNCYETEAFSIIKLILDDPYILLDEKFLPSNGASTIGIIVGGEFNILFAPYLPLWLLQLLKDTSDYGTPKDAVAFLGVGGNEILKAIFFIANIIIGIIIAILELVFIRGAVVNIREIQDQANLLKRGTNRYSGFNQLGCQDTWGGELQPFDTNSAAYQETLTIQAAITANRKESNELIAEQSELRGKAQKAKKSYDNYESDLAKLKEDLVKLEEDLAKLEERLANEDDEDKQSNLKQRISGKEDQIDDKEQEIEDFEDKTKDEWFEEYLDYTEQAEALQPQIDTLSEERKVLQEDLKRAQALLFDSAPFCEQFRNIYNIEVLNEKQYGQFGLNPYIVVDVFFSEKSIIENFDIVTVNGNVTDIGLPQSRFLKYNPPPLDTTTFVIEDRELNSYDVLNRLRPTFNGDTFITKYFYKISHNAAFAVPNIGQNNLNRFTLERMYRGGGGIILGPVALPIPNFLAFPGSAFAASVSNNDGRIFSFLGDSETPEDVATDGIESVQIIQERVADPIYPARDGMSMRGGNWVWLESDINTEYRHRPVSYINSAAKAGGTDQFSSTGDPDNAKLGVPYYPKDSLAWCFEVTPEYGQSNGYNQQYSIQNNIKQYVSRPFGQIPVSEWRYRTIYSEPIDSPTFFGKPQKSEFSDKYRIYLPFSYQDIPKNKGVITNTFELNGEFFVHSERSLWRTFFNTKAAIPSTTAEVFLGNAGIFQNPAVEMQPMNGGYAGTLHKWANALTPFGYIFVDYYNKKVFKFTGQLEEISAIGMYNWFTENLNVLNDSNNVINPLGTGLVGFYDPYYKRYVLSIKNIPNTINISPTNDSFTIETPTLNETDSLTNRTYSVNYTTLSFSIQDNSWVSFHDYLPAITLNLDNQIYSSGNYISNSIFNHNKVIGRQNRVLSGLYGVYYNQTVVNFGGVITPVTIYPYSILFSISDNPGATKVFDNLVINAELFNESTVEQIVHHGDFFDTLEAWTDSQYSGVVPVVIHPYTLDPSGLPFEAMDSNCKIYNREFRLSLPSSYTIDNRKNLFQKEENRDEAIDIFLPANLDQNLEYSPRLKGKYCLVKLTYNNNSANFNRQVFPLTKPFGNLSFALYNIMSKYRINSR